MEFNNIELLEKLNIYPSNWGLEKAYLWDGMLTCKNYKEF